MFSTLPLLVLISIIGCVELITVSTPHKRINVTMGQSLALGCSFATIEQTTNLVIQWDFVSSSDMKTDQIYYYQSGSKVIGAEYKNRLQPPSSPNTTRNASIIISNMQSSDAGVYTCQVHNFPDVDGKSEVNIVVNVLEKPSTPYCSVHGDVESGHLVTLTCHSEHGSPPPKYTWIKLDETKARKPVLAKATTTGKLVIQNISQFEFGEYQCSATNVVGSAVCTVELNADVSDGVIAGAVIGALLGFVLILLVVWFVAHSVKKHKYNAVKAAEGNEMKRSAPRAQAASDGVPVATTAGSLHAEEDEPGA